LFIYPAIGAVIGCLGGTLFVIALLRFGLVVLAAMIMVGSTFFPITADFSAWYAGYGLFVLLAVLALAVYGFHTALAGQSVFRGKLLED
jgi:hypothetical protein